MISIQNIIVSLKSTTFPFHNLTTLSIRRMETKALLLTRRTVAYNVYSRAEMSMHVQEGGSMVATLGHYNIGPNVVNS